MATQKDFKVKNGLIVGGGDVSVSSGSVSISDQISGDTGQISISNGQNGDSFTRIGITGSGTADSYIRTHSNLDFHIGQSATSTTPSVSINTSGAITSANIDVTGASGGNGQITVARTSGSTVAIQSQSARGLIGTSTNHPFRLMSNGTQRIELDTSGNFNLLSGALEINGNTVIDSSRNFINASSIANNLASVDYSGVMYDSKTTTTQTSFNSSNALAYGSDLADIVIERRHGGIKHSVLGLSGSLIDLRINNSSGDSWSAAHIIGVGDPEGGSGYQGGLVFATGGGGTDNPTGRRTKGVAPTARMLIGASGNVRILTGSLYMGSTELITSSGNLVNIGTISNSAFTIPNSIGSAGQVLKVPSSGTTLEWGNDTGLITSITNFADNRILTASGSTTINAEANLTYNGDRISITDGTFTGYIGDNSSVVGGDADDFVVSSSQRLVLGSIGYGRVYIDGSDINVSGNLEINGVQVISSARNMSNIGTISSGTITITDAAVPLKFVESGNTGNGQYWRMPLDSGNLRFDVSLSGGAGFTTYDNILQLNSDGTIDIQSAQMFDSSGNISTTKTISSGHITVNTSTFKTTNDAIGLFTTDLTVGNDVAQQSTATPKRIFFNNDYSSGYTDASLKLYLFNDSTTRQGFTSGPAYDLQYHSSGSSSGRHAFYVANVEEARIDAGGIDIRNGGLDINGTEVISSSRNLTNIGTISSGAITTSGDITLSSDSTQIKFTGTGGPFGLEFGDTENNPNFRIYYRTSPNSLTFEDNSESAKHTFTLDGDYTAARDLISSQVVRVGTSISMGGGNAKSIDFTGTGTDTVARKFIYEQSDHHYVTNRHTDGDLVLMSNNGTGGGETTRITLQSGSGTQDIDITNANLDMNSNNINNAGTISSGAITTSAALQVQYSGTNNISLSPTSTGGVINARNSSGTSVVVMDGRGTPFIDVTGNLKTGGTTRIDSSGNLSNIGTISSGAITATSDLNQLRLMRTDDAGDDWRFYSWTSGLNIFPSDEASTVWFGRDGQATNVSVYNGNLQIGTTTVIDSSRNLTNIGTISSGAITSTSSITANSGGNVIQIGTDGNIEITRTAGGAYIDFKDSTSEDFDQRIQATSTGHSFSGTISSGAITSSGDLAIDTDTLFVDVSANRVGIGEDSLDAKLHISDATLSNIKLERLGVKKFALGVTGTDFRIDGTNDDLSTPSFTIDTSNNVGIGLTSLTEKFEVNGSINTSNQSSNFNTGTYRTFMDMISSSKIARIGTLKGANTPTGSQGSIYFTVNGTTEAVLDQDGNLLVGTTNVDPAGADVAGTAIGATGYISMSRSSGAVGIFNRKTNDGNIIEFNKDGTPVGSIGSALGDSSVSTLFIADAGNVGIRFDQAATDDIQPCNSSGADRDNAINLGASDNRFKDLYLSGTARSNTVSINGTTVIDSSRKILNLNGGMTLQQDGTYGSGYGMLSFSGTTNGHNRIFARNDGSDSLYICSATSRNITFRTNGGTANTFAMTSGGDLQMNDITVIDSSRNLTNIGTISSSYFYTSGNINATGVAGATVGGGRLGFDESGTRSWTMGVSSGYLNVFSGDGNGDLNLANSIGLRQNGTLVLDSSRNLSNIGTISSGAITSSGTLSLGSHFQAGTNVLAGFFQDSANGAYRAIGTSSNRGFYFQSNAGANTYMYVGLTGTYAGRVGVGTASPAEQFHATGVARVGSLKIGTTTVIDSSRNLTNIVGGEIGNSTDSRGILTINHSTSNTTTSGAGTGADIGDSNRALTLNNPNNNGTASNYVALSFNLNPFASSSRCMADIKLLRSGTNSSANALHFTQKHSDGVFYNNLVINSNGTINTRGGITTNTGGIHVAGGLTFAQGNHFLGEEGGQGQSEDLVLRTGADTNDQTIKIQAGYGNPGDVSGKIQLYTDGDTTTPKLEIDADGNIKMGSTQIISNGRNLTNIGTITAGGDIASRTSAYPGGRLILDRTASSSGAMTSSEIHFRAYGNNTTLRTFGKIEGRSTGYTDGQIMFYTQNSGTLTETLTLDSSQNATFAGDINLEPSSAIHMDFGSGMTSDIVTGSGSTVKFGGISTNDDVTAQLVAFGENGIFEVGDGETTIQGSHGELLHFKTSSTEFEGAIGSRSESSYNLFMEAGSGTSAVGFKVMTAFGSHYISPSQDQGATADNMLRLGFSSNRYKELYAVDGSINTSDRNEKQDIQTLSDAEQRVATACKGLIRRYKWNHAVEEKGDDARYHFGIIAQDLQDAFTTEGLDAGDYGMFISDTWTDDDGVEQTRLGVRYNELLAFIIATL